MRVLQYINTAEKNILTVEDPVEYILDGIGQIQVNPKIQLDFAKALRSFLRQDPDVIMVGEVRDEETARIAIQAALTGHLVFSTLHTNDSASALTRLVDMGIEPYLLTSSVTAILAQRLVRRICPNCREIYDPTPFERKLLEEYGKGGNSVVYKGKGCPECLNTGYLGRIGILVTQVTGDVDDFTGCDTAWFVRFGGVDDPLDRASGCRLFVNGNDHRIEGTYGDGDGGVIANPGSQ